MTKKINNYEVAKIVNTFGYKGEVRVKSLTDFKRLEENSLFYTFLEKNKINLKIKEIRPANNFYIVRFFEIDNIEDAKRLKGLFIYTDEKPEVKDNEYHYQDLIGLDVVLENGEKIGKVIDLIFNPSQQILKIKGKERIILIPFVEEFVKEINSKITITPIEGLL